jgi:hypothetical protein
LARLDGQEGGEGGESAARVAHFHDRCVILAGKLRPAPDGDGFRGAAAERGEAFRRHRKDQVAGLGALPRRQHARNLTIAVAAELRRKRLRYVTDPHRRTCQAGPYCENPSRNVKPAGRLRMRP